MNGELTANELIWSVGPHRILDGVSLHASPGEVVGIVGPNGSGKSTTLRCLYRHLRPSSGTVVLNGEDIAKVSARSIARSIAVVLQDMEVDAGTTVAQVIALGRLPHQGLLARMSAADGNAIAGAEAHTGVAHLHNRDYRSLSGGERQRVQLSRALAQQPSVLLLDEPTNHLDLRFQFELVQTVKSLGVTTIAVLHDLALAAAFCDRLIVLESGRVVAQGPANGVLTVELIRDVWGVEVEILRSPSTGRLAIVSTMTEPSPPLASAGLLVRDGSAEGEGFGEKR